MVLRWQSYRTSLLSLRHLPYGITHCYLIPGTSERVLSSPQPACRYSIYLPWRDGRLSWPRLHSNRTAQPESYCDRKKSQVLTTTPQSHPWLLTLYYYDNTAVKWHSAVPLWSGSSYLAFVYIGNNGFCFAADCKHNNRKVKCWFLSVSK